MALLTLPAGTLKDQDQVCSTIRPPSVQLGSWALGRAVCCRYPDGDVLVLDELEESDWVPGHRSGRREQVIQVLVGLLVAYSQRGAGLMMEMIAYSLITATGRGKHPRRLDGDHKVSLAELKQFKTLWSSTSTQIYAGGSEGGPELDYKRKLSQ
ncbi:hypothetical protein ROHU_027043 [Labeo rohita]|uniref:Uncharacterized protein n=1 Tax=Labeo rohita TaxID=84645 RepID=A0A498MC20_LABRO|nr:hypothetical protein ROHU_027043 [Labeo rohita]